MPRKQRPHMVRENFGAKLDTNGSAGCDGDIVVYRSTDSAVLGSAYAPSARAGSAIGPRAGSAIWGDEQPFDA